MTNTLIAMIYAPMTYNYSENYEANRDRVSNDQANA
jgi:hypothetical protein